MSALPAESDDSYDDLRAPTVAPLPAASAPARVRRAGLHVVPAARRSSAPLAPFVAVVTGLLVLGLAALLGLNTLLAQDAFRIHDLRQANARLGEREQALGRELAALESPATLAERAESLGMLPSSTPLFLRLPDGAVLGAAPEGGQGSADADALAAVEAATGGAASEGPAGSAGSASGQGSAQAPEDDEAEQASGSESAGAAEEDPTGSSAESGTRSGADSTGSADETDGGAETQEDQ